MMKLFGGNLGFQTTQQDLMNAFTPYGNVESVHVLTDRTTGQSRGFGFVEMSDRQEAENAINALNGAELNGRTMTRTTISMTSTSWRMGTKGRKRLRSRLG